MADPQSVKGVNLAIKSGVGLVYMNRRVANDNAPVATTAEMNNVKSTALMIVKYLVSIDASLKAQVQSNMFMYNQSSKQQREDIVEQYRGFGNEEAAVMDDAVPVIQETSSSISGMAAALTAGAAAIAFAGYKLYDMLEGSISNAMGSLGSMVGLGGSQEPEPAPEREVAPPAPIKPAPPPKQQAARSNVNPPSETRPSASRVASAMPTAPAATAAPTAPSSTPSAPQASRTSAPPVVKPTVTPETPSTPKSDKSTDNKTASINASDVIQFTGRSGDQAHFDTLEPATKAAILAAAAEYKLETGNKLTLNSGRRTNAEQWALWNDRANNPNPVAYPGTSNHEKGWSVDIGQAGDPIARRILEKHGMVWYGSEDPVHYTLKGHDSGGGGGGLLGAIATTFEDTKAAFSKFSAEMKTKMKLMDQVDTKDNKARPISPEMALAQHLKRAAAEKESDMLMNARKSNITRTTTSKTPPVIMEAPVSYSTKDRSASIINRYFLRMLGTEIAAV